MRIFIVIDETSFFHPSFLNDLLLKIKDEVVGVALVTKIPKKSDLKRFLIKNIYLLKLSEIAKLSIFTLKIKLLNIFNNRYYGSVKSVLLYHKIPFINVKKNINQEIYISFIKKMKPHVIISSNSLIFKKEILSIPKYCCINRHSSLLPLYAGLWPVFHAFIKREKNVGVSVHIMTEKIDAGLIIAQKKIAININDTIFTLYKKCFDISAGVIISALDKINNFNNFNNYDSEKLQYFSFPTREDWKLLRKRNGRFI